MIQTGSNGIPAYMNVTPAGNGYGGDGFGMGGFGGGWWMLMYFVLFAMMGGGFGGFGGNNMLPWMLMGNNNSNNTNNDVQRGFDQAALTTGIGNINTNVTNGFAGVNQNMCNGFAQAEIAANGRQMADIQQNYQNQISTLTSFNNMMSRFDQCCCDNRLGLANLTSTVLSENCADRNALSEAMMLMSQQNTANTQRLVDTIVGIGNNIDNKLCQLELDGKNDKIDDLQRQVTESNMRNMFIQYCGNNCGCGTCG